jgi:hypothetical protein
MRIILSLWNCLQRLDKVELELDLLSFFRQRLARLAVLFPPAAMKRLQSLGVRHHWKSTFTISGWTPESSGINVRQNCRHKACTVTTPVGRPCSMVHRRPSRVFEHGTVWSYCPNRLVNLPNTGNNECDVRACACRPRLPTQASVWIRKEWFSHNLSCKHVQSNDGVVATLSLASRKQELTR